MSEKDRLINIISRNSDRHSYGPCGLIAFMEAYSLNRLADATADMLREFILAHGEGMQCAKG